MFLLIGLPFAMAVESFDPTLLLSIVADTQVYRKDRLAMQSPTIPESAYREAAAGKVATGLSGQVGWGVGYSKWKSGSCMQP